MPIEHDGYELICSNENAADLVAKIIEAEPFLNASNTRNLLIHPAGKRDQAKKNLRKIQDILDRTSIPNQPSEEGLSLQVSNISLEELATRLSAMGLIAEAFRNEILVCLETPKFRRKSAIG
jgi:hypothetical protein